MNLFGCYGNTQLKMNTSIHVSGPHKLTVYDCILLQFSCPLKTRAAVLTGTNHRQIHCFYRLSH